MIISNIFSTYYCAWPVLYLRHSWLGESELFHHPSKSSRRPVMRLALITLALPLLTGGRTLSPSYMIKYSMSKPLYATARIEILPRFKLLRDL